MTSTHDGQVRAVGYLKDQPPYCHVLPDPQLFRNTSCNLVKPSTAETANSYSPKARSIN